MGRPMGSSCSGGTSFLITCDLDFLGFVCIVSTKTRGMLLKNWNIFRGFFCVPEIYRKAIVYLHLQNMWTGLTYHFLGHCRCGCWLLFVGATCSLLLGLALDYDRLWTTLHNHRHGFAVTVPRRPLSGHRKPVLQGLIMEELSQ